MVSDTALRLARELPTAGAQWALLTAPDSVAYVSGRAVPIEAGPSPFAGGPTVAVVSESGRCVVVATNIEAAESLADETVSYTGFSAQDPEDLLRNFVRAVNEAIDLAGVTGTAAVESGSLPQSVAEVLRARGHAWRDVSTALARARMIKTAREVGLLRESGRIAGRAQRAARDAAKPGMTELEVFSRLRTTSERLAGERVPFAGDLVSGVERTAAGGGWPGNRVLATGDLVMADLAPRVAGYWADCCSTFAVGAPTSAQQLIFDCVHSALDLAESLLVPGTPMSEIDRTVRAQLAKDDFSYFHHTGHSIGTSVHEYPRIIPGEPACVEVGMVLLLEPGAYVPGVGGVRLERMYLVGEDGPETLTDFPMHV